MIPLFKGDDCLVYLEITKLREGECAHWPMNWVGVWRSLTDARMQDGVCTIEVTYHFPSVKVRDKWLSGES